MERVDQSGMQLSDMAELLWSKGKFIEGIEGKDYDTTLYSYEGMYVEVVYSLEKNTVEEVNILKDKKRLRKYLGRGATMFSEPDCGRNAFYL